MYIDVCFLQNAADLKKLKSAGICTVKVLMSISEL